MEMFKNLIVWQKAMELSTPKTMTMSTQERIAVVGQLEGIFKVVLEKYALLASSVQVMVDEKLFENMVVSGIRKQMFNQGCD